MVKLTRDEILKLATLARLKLSDKEVKLFQTELSTILDYVEQLQAVQTDNVEPTYQVTGLKSVTRADKVFNYGVSTDDLLKNLPERKGNYIKVKRVL